MTIYHWILLFSFSATCIYFTFLVIQSLSTIKSSDFSKAKGRKLKAVAYSITGAMSPKKKETAFLHLPTYTAGIIYHLGTFLSFILTFLIFINISFSLILILICSIFLAVSGICGLLILLKRIFNKRLKSISVPDDYFSNILTTIFQFILAFTLIYNEFLSVLLIITSIILLYMTIGKLRHAVYFLSARIYLGIFYGLRGVWPHKKVIK